MKEMIFLKKNEQYPLKIQRFSFSFFVFTTFLISFLVFGYICSNITLIKLGYQSLDLEKKRDELLVEKGQLEYHVENLSSLTRIEKIAIQELGMCRPEKIEFVAMLPSNIKTDVAALPSAEPEQENRFLAAGVFFQELSGLRLFQNR
jgi:cell division protein FtsL